MNNEIRLITTENPLLDEIVYNCKIMMCGTVLKDNDKADLYETLESLKSSDLFMASVEKKTRFQDYEYTIEFLKTCSYIMSYNLITYANDNSKIPQSYRERIVRDMQNYYVDHYEEENEYYRTLNGLPPYDDNQSIKLSTIDISSLPEEFEFTENARYIHELDDFCIETLKSAGIIDNLISKYPDYKYLNYLGSDKIDIYKARKASHLGVLKVPVPSSIEVYNRYIERLSINRNYIIRRVYTEAFKYQSDHYNDVMKILIVLTSFLDCVAELPEYYIQNNIFDIRTIRYIFESNGIPYFDDIPIKYQLRMVRNLHSLIKYKATNKCIVDICSLFGFDNIEVFKYYILRDRKMTSDGNYVYATKFDEVTQTEIEDVESEYELKFLKVPLEGSADDYIRDPLNILDYDAVTLGDILWDGPYSHESIKKQIIEHEFNVELSKYISIDAVYELAKMSFDLPYFINMIMFNTIDLKQLKCYIPTISVSSDFFLTDLFVFLYALMFKYLGIKDRIFDERSEILSVVGFNFEVDLPALINWLEDRGETLSSLGVENFNTGSTGVLTFSQLVNIFVTNKNVYDTVRKGMINAQDKNEYDIYKKLYNSFFVTDMNWEYYNLPQDKEERKNYTYTKFLSTKDVELYNTLMEVDSITNDEQREQKINNLISTVTDKIEEVLDTDILDTIFANMPTISIDFVKNYIFEVIDFFKSYKVDVMEINTIYRFDDKLDNRVFVIDKIEEMIYTHLYVDRCAPKSKAKISSTISPEDIVELKEKVYETIRWFSQHTVSEQELYIDMMYEIISKFEENEYIDIHDEKFITVTLKKFDWVPIIEKIAYMIVKLTYIDQVQIEDSVFDILRWFSRIYSEAYYYFDTSLVTSYVYLSSYVNYKYEDSGIKDNEHYGMNDFIIEKNHTYNKIDYIKIVDGIDRNNIFLSYDDIYTIRDECYIEVEHSNKNLSL